ncbi:Cupredoxin [Blastocladiella britannica]|nr:Cupredoxin [Blastocladiella britannica]
MNPLLLTLLVLTLAASSTRAEANPCPKNDKCSIWTYYVAATETTWDYAPSGKNGFSGESLDKDGENSAVYAASSKGRIGKKYTKAVYVQYTDATFSKVKARGADEEHLGIMGPVLRAEVNQVIRIVFKNMAGSPYSMHPHGVFYDKDNEGASMGPDAGLGGSVAPGGNYTYTWPVPARAGPAEADVDSVAWAYHSHVAETDIYDGLYGPLVVYKPGRLSDVGLPKYDSASFTPKREFFLSFVVGNENLSSFLARNVATFAGNTTFTDDEKMLLPAATQSNATALALAPAPEGFGESNMMHNINGMFYGNLPGIAAELGDSVRFYLMAFGTEVDLHTIHWHGITVVSEGHRRDVIEALPATFRVADAKLDNPGAWMIHCHVHDHFMAGMVAIFNITNPKQLLTANDFMASGSSTSFSVGSSVVGVLAAVAIAFAL